MPIVTLEDLQKTAQNVSETALSLTSKITTSQTALDRAVESRLGPTPELAFRRIEWDKAANQLRRDHVAMSDASRWEHLRVMSEAEAEVLKVEKQFASPSMILTRAGLGSEKRSRYLEQISSAGPLEIQNYAEHAKRTGDMVLGAAIMTRLDSMPKRDRDAAGVSRAKLAESLAGEQFRAAQNAIKTVRVTVRESLALNRSFESGRAVSAKDKVGIAIQRGGLSA